MKVTRFDPSDSLIIVRAWLWGPRGKAKLDLALDTAATHTHIVPDIIDELGYSPRQGDGMTVIHSAIGEEPGYLLRVSRFQALGFSISDFRIHVHDLGDGAPSHGVVAPSHGAVASTALEASTPFRGLAESTPAGRTPRRPKARAGRPPRSCLSTNALLLRLSGSSNRSLTREQVHRGL